MSAAVLLVSFMTFVVPSGNVVGAASPLTSTDLAAPDASGYFQAVSCADPLDCTGVGYDHADSASFFMTEAGGTWEKPVDFASGMDIADISCPSAANCTASGSDNGELVTVSDVDGTWGTPVVVAIFGTFYSISCVDASDCTAVGNDETTQQPVVDTEVAGSWGPAIEFAPIATSYADFGQLDGVSCVGVGDCTAVGDDSGEPFYLTQTSGVWGVLTNLDIPSDEGLLDAISCSDATDCTAVGVDASQDTLLYATESDGVWDVPESFPPSGTAGVFSSISCVSAANCMAVGEEGTIPDFYASEVDGVWGPVTSVPAQGSGEFSGVSCSGNVCTAVGLFAIDNTYAPFYATMRFGTWSVPATVALPLSAGTLVSVSCPDATECLAIGTDSANKLTFDDDYVNATWGDANDVSYGTENILGGTLVATGISCADATDCVAVGNQVLGANFELPYYQTETNGTWGFVEQVFDTGAVLGISCADASDCTAVGYDSNSDTPVYATDVAGNWADQVDLPSANPGGEFTAVSCPDASDCTAVGVDGDGQPLLASETGGTWGPVVDLAAPEDLATLFGVSCVDASDCTAVGIDGSGQPIYVAETSGQWGAVTDLATPDTGTLFGVSCSDATDCTAVGGDTTLDQPFYVTESNGVWDHPMLARATGGGGAFHGVSCSSALHCVAVGDDTVTDQPLYDDLTPVTTPPPPPPAATIATTTTVPVTTTTVATTTTTAVPTHVVHTVRGVVHFSRDSAVLTRRDRRILERVAMSLVATKANSLTIVGYASPSGGVALNQRLSLVRARVVARDMVRMLRRQRDDRVRFIVRGGGIRRLASVTDDQIATVIS